MEFNSKLSGVLSSLGITLITAGVVALAFQKWDNISLTTKLACILGYGLITYVLSLYIANKKTYPEISATLLINAVGMIVWGIEVYIDNYPIYHILKSTRVFESGILLTLFAISWCTGHQVISLAGSIICTQALYLSIIKLILNTNSFTRDGLVISIMLVGLNYLVKQFSSSLSYFLKLIGSLLIGVVLYKLGDWTIWSHNVASFFTYSEIMWQILWPIVGIILVYLGLKLSDNAFFIGGMASIIGVIFSVASTYARFILGLPITLVLFGIMSIVVSYGMIQLKNKVG